GAAHQGGQVSRGGRASNRSTEVLAFWRRRQDVSPSAAIGNRRSASDRVSAPGDVATYPRPSRTAEAAHVFGRACRPIDSRIVRCTLSCQAHSKKQLLNVGDKKRQAVLCGHFKQCCTRRKPVRDRGQSRAFCTGY